MRVQVVAYDSHWPAQFDMLRRELSVALADVPVLAVEHVGSTSVPGLAAKPVIDIDIVVAAEQVSAAIAALADVGYSSLGELGVPDRHALAAPDDGVRRHVYVTVDGCLSLRNHLAVRDVLRADESLRAEYGAFKLGLAEQELTGIDEYVAAKSEILQRVLARGGIDPSERSDILRINAQDP